MRRGWVALGRHIGDPLGTACDLLQGRGEGERALADRGALAIGLDSAVDNATGLAVISTLLGTWLALILCVLNGAHYVSLAAEKNKQWLNIGIRVAGSWIVAISLLVIAFALRKPGH